MNKELDYAIATHLFLIKRFGHNSPYTRTLESAIRVAFGKEGINALHNSSPYTKEVSAQAPTTASRVLLASGPKQKEPDAVASKKKPQEQPEPLTRSRRKSKRGAADEVSASLDQPQPTDAWPVEEE